MSFLDAIKNLFAGKKSDENAVEETTAPVSEEATEAVPQENSNEGEASSEQTE